MNITKYPNGTTTYTGTAFPTGDFLLMLPTLSALSGIYNRFLDKNKFPLYSRPASIITFAGLMHNGSFLLSHLSNQGASNRFV